MTEKKKGGLEFDSKKTGKEVFNFMKSSLDASLDNVGKVQDLNERMLLEMMKRGRIAEEDSQRAVNEFLKKAKKESAAYRKLLDDGFRQIKKTLEGK